MSFTVSRGFHFSMCSSLGYLVDWSVHWSIGLPFLRETLRSLYSGLSFGVCYQRDSKPVPSCFSISLPECAILYSNLPIRKLASRVLDFLNFLEFLQTYLPFGIRHSYLTSMSHRRHVIACLLSACIYAHALLFRCVLVSL